MGTTLHLGKKEQFLCAQICKSVVMIPLKQELKECKSKDRSKDNHYLVTGIKEISHAATQALGQTKLEGQHRHSGQRLIAPREPTEAKVYVEGRPFR